MKNDFRKILVSLASGITFSIPLILALFLAKGLTKDKELYCDLNKSIFAEREYIYPILRELGYDPHDYGKDIENPITTKSKYNKHCS